MGKHKKRKRSLQSQTETSADELPTSEDVPPVQKKAKSNGSDEKREDDKKQINVGTLPLESKKKKKKKLKKNKKSKHKKTPMSKDTVPQSDDEGTTSEPTLEGSMVEGEMVLIDRSKKKVYAALEVNDDGSRKQIGYLDKDGEICWSKDTALSEKNTGTAVECVAEEDAARTSTKDTITDFPFETDEDDHCESPLEAYQDIVPLLQQYARSLSKEPKDLKIYDPYFCNGAVIRNLTSLGFPNVYNQKEDCYQVWENRDRSKKGGPGSFDVLVTNPPYSGDHMERLMRFITSPAFGNRPWLLLLPQWVHKKDYYVSCTSRLKPFYMVPKKRYVYLPPKSFRQAKASDVHKKSSPFVSMWYLWGGTSHSPWYSTASRSTTCEAARSKSALRDLRRKPKKGSRR